MSKVFCAWGSLIGFSRNAYFPELSCPRDLAEFLPERNFGNFFTLASVMLISEKMHEFLIRLAEAYSEPCQTSKMEHFAKIVNAFQLLTIFAKHSILYVWLGSECACGQFQNSELRGIFSYLGLYRRWSNFYENS